MLLRVLLAACALATARAGVMPKTLFADMHDGDAKDVEITTRDGRWYLTLSQDAPRWHLTTELDAKTSTAVVDASTSSVRVRPSKSSTKICMVVRRGRRAGQRSGAAPGAGALGPPVSLHYAVAAGSARVGPRRAVQIGLSARDGPVRRATPTALRPDYLA